MLSGLARRTLIVPVHCTTMRGARWSALRSASALTPSREREGGAIGMGWRWCTAMVFLRLGTEVRGSICQRPLPSTSMVSTGEVRIMHEMHERRGSHAPHIRAVSTHERHSVARRPGSPASSSRPQARLDGHVQAPVLGTAAGAAGLLLGSSLLSPARAAGRADPRPIPGGFSEFGAFLPPALSESGHRAIRKTPRPSPTSTGTSAWRTSKGMGTHTDKTTGLVSHLPYRVDLRFMKGVYVGKDGKPHHGAFAAI